VSAIACVYIVPELPLAAIVGGVVAGLIIIAIIVVVILVIIWRRRSSKPTDDTDSIDPDKKETLFPGKSSKPIAFGKFSEHVAMLARNTNLEYSSEYEVSLRWFCTIAYQF